MEKIIYLARKLKAFTFEDIFMLAEMHKGLLFVDKEFIYKL